MNIRSVHAVQSIGQSGLSQMCASMDLPQPVTFNSHNSILQHVGGNAVGMAKQIMHGGTIGCRYKRRIFGTCSCGSDS